LSGNGHAVGKRVVHLYNGAVVMGVESHIGVEIGAHDIVAEHAGAVVKGRHVNVRHIRGTGKPVGVVVVHRGHQGVAPAIGKAARLVGDG
jgi:hypothetical protein